VLDIGCGAGGKTLYYAALGARRVVGIDVVEAHLAQARQLARDKGLAHRVEFLRADAAHIPLPDSRFDTIVANDVMEHVDHPARVLSECVRVLGPGGRLYVNFPPYCHPYGHHLSDAIGIPWIHALVGERTLLRLYASLLEGKPDAAGRLALRTGEDPDSERLAYINHMTVRRFGRLAAQLPLRQVYYHEEPLRPFLAPAARLPGLHEFLVKMVVYVGEKID